jgi:hypothetical protein
MKKAGTHVPARRSACIVFAALKGQKSPRTGFLAYKDSPHAAQMAARVGLKTLKVSGAGAHRLCDQLAEGDIGRNGQVRLLAFGPEMLAALSARYDTQTGKQPKAAANVSPESTLKLANGAPPPGSPQPPSNSIDLGPRLLESYRLVDAAGNWLEKLQAELGEVLGQIGRGSEFSFLQDTETTDLDHYTGGEGWIFDGWRWTFPTRHRKQRIGNLSAVADIGRPGRPAAVIGAPCLLVMWSGAAHDWTAAVDAARDFWPPSDRTTALLGGCLFQWTGKVAGNGPASTSTLRDAAWFYVVRLAELTNFAQLRALVVQPAVALLGGAPIDTVFAKAPGVLRFRQFNNEFVVDK